MSWHRFKDAVRDGVAPHAVEHHAVLWKKDSSPPDYTPMANASKEAAEIMAGLGREQLAFARDQYNQNAPILRDIAQQQMAAQNQQMAQAQDYYNYMQNTYRPLERSLVRDAQNFNTEAYRQEQASKAAADVGRAYTASNQANTRAMASMGVNPNSGRFAGQQRASNLGLAAQRAAAMTGARSQADQMGYARKLDAAGLGRNLAGASTAAYGGATGAGSAAGNSFQSAGNNFANQFNMGANTIGSGQNMQLQGLGNILNSQTQMAINGGDNGFWGGLGAIAGAGAKIYTASDRRLKDNIKLVGVDSRTALNVYEFNYKDQPEKRWVGVMADEVEMVYPDAVTTRPDGYMAVDYNALGIEFKEAV